MITKADLKQEVEKLDDSCLALVFRLLQQYQKNKPDLLACSRPIHYPDNEVSDGTAFTDIENAAEYGKQLRISEIMADYLLCDTCVIIDTINGRSS